MNPSTIKAPRELLEGVAALLEYAHLEGLDNASRYAGELRELLAPVLPRQDELGELERALGRFKNATRDLDDAWGEAGDLAFVGPWPDGWPCMEEVVAQAAGLRTHINVPSGRVQVERAPEHGWYVRAAVIDAPRYHRSTLAEAVALARGIACPVENAPPR